MGGLILKRGSHAIREQGMCAMEAVAWLAGEPHSDAPACTCPIIAEAVRMINDLLLEQARNTVLLPRLQRIIGTNEPAMEETRYYIIHDWLWRTCLPAHLEGVGFGGFAEPLRTHPPIVDSSAVLAVASMVKTMHVELRDSPHRYRVEYRAALFALSTALDVDTLPTDASQALRLHAVATLIRQGIRLLVASDDAARNTIIGALIDRLVEAQVI